MSAARTLLERLEEPEDPKDRELEQSQERLVASIQANLGRLLNSQRGFSPIAPEYGLSEILDVSLNTQAMGRTEADIKKSIERFEPRLTNVQVRFVASNDVRLALRFDIVGTIRVRGESRPARFLTLLDPSGELEVSRA